MPEPTATESATRAGADDGGLRAAIYAVGRGAECADSRAARARIPGSYPSASSANTMSRSPIPTRPTVTREFLDALATKPVRILTVTPAELDAMIDDFFGADEEVARAPTSLAEILVSSDTLTSEQVAEAAFYAAQTGTSLGPAAVQLGYVNPWILAVLISRYLAKPVVNLRTQQFPEEVAALLPQEFLRARRVVPIGLAARRPDARNGRSVRQ